MTALQDLGLPPTATAQQVSREFRRRARTAHPDRGGTSERFARLYALYRAALEESRHAAAAGPANTGDTARAPSAGNTAANTPSAPPSSSPPFTSPFTPPVATPFSPPAQSSATPPPTLTPASPSPPLVSLRFRPASRVRSLGTVVRRGLGWIPLTAWVTAWCVLGLVAAAVGLTDWTVTPTRHSAPRLAYPIETLFDGASEQLAPRVGAAVLTLLVGWGLVLAIRPRSWRTVTWFLIGATVMLLFTFGHTLAGCLALITLLAWWGRHAHSSDSRSTAASPTVVRS